MKLKEVSELHTVPYSPIIPNTLSCFLSLTRPKNTFHVIVEQSSAHSCLSIDPTNKFMRDWLQSPDKIPELHQLSYFLKETPNVKIPLSKEIFSSIPVVGPFSIDPIERDKYFTESRSESC